MPGINRHIFLKKVMERVILNNSKRLLVMATVLSSLVRESNAQLSRKSQEVWPSVDAYYKFNPRLRLYATASATKLDSSSYSDAAAGIFIDYFTFPLFKKIPQNHTDSLPGKYMYLRAGYQYSATPPSSKDPFKENMVVTEINARYYLPFNVLFTWKNRFDWRVNNGDFKARYRPRIMLEKDLHTEYLSFTASGFAEYFANFDNSAVNKFKTQLGVEFRVTKKLNYEVFWNHQFAHEPEVQSVDAFGMTLKIYLSKKNPAKQKKQVEKPNAS